MAQPVSLWKWHSMSHDTTDFKVLTSSYTCLGLAQPTVSAIPTLFTPILSTVLLSDVRHVLTVRILSQKLGGSNDHIDTINTCLNCNLSIIHMTSDVSQNLSLKPKFTNGLAIDSTLLGGNRRGQFNVVDTKVIQSLGDFNLFFCAEEGVGKLLTFSQGRLNQLERSNV
ncbi:hypothetical protein OGATHE_001441 [Ogataea polymorpha]|uniref:Uncharacterized protein n=1 Tax=Ogataea polymorpha TaxID=460523 RepID=A0A9P8TFH1_9ASCO|nr:hypothetical protein OGATHE_001441 [Ogataea polymorpha]